MPYSVFRLGTTAMSRDQMGDHDNEVNLAVSLDIAFERYDPAGYCPIE